MKENLYRAAFWILIASALFVFALGSLWRGLLTLAWSVNWKWVAFWAVVFTLIYTWPTEGSDFVQASVSPRVALVNPYKRTDFRFTWRIEPHPDNRRYALMYTCGKELHSSQGEVEGDKHPRTTERYVELTVVEDCTFMACVVRVIEGKPKTLCDYAYVRTGGKEP